jgi:hypothetical protein
MNIPDDPRSNVGDARSIRSTNGSTVKTLAKGAFLAILGARLAPGVVVGTAHMATVVVSGWILLTVVLGLSPYWLLLSRRASGTPS